MAYWRVVLVSLLISWSMGTSARLTVFAASSLTNALQELADTYQQRHHIQIVISFASSSNLARQIVQGAPADLFISADQQWMEYALTRQAIDPARHVLLLTNELVLVAPALNHAAPVKISRQTDWLSLLQGQRLAIGDPDYVPAGIYARQALQHLGAWQQLVPLLAPSNNVRAALALVERGETPYGIVYRSDAKVSQQVQQVGVFPAESHIPIVYPIAIVRGHATPQVLAFYHYLQGPQAAAVFKRVGFTPP